MIILCKDYLFCYFSKYQILEYLCLLNLAITLENSWVICLITFGLYIVSGMDHMNGSGPLNRSDLVTFFYL